MKKLLALLLVFLMLILAVVGCSKTGDGQTEEPVSSEELSADFEDVETEEDEEVEEDFEEEEEIEEDLEEEESEEEEEEEEEPEEETEEPEEESSEPEEEEEPVESDKKGGSKDPVSSKKPTSSKVESTESEEEPEEEPEEPEEEPEEESSEPESSEPESSEPEEEEEPLTPEELRLEQMLLGKDEELNKDAIYHEGNLSRLAKAIKKSKSGEKVTIVCYGNSANTSRNSDTTEADVPYSSIIRDWWTEQIGPCNVIESGMEHLTSINACMRVEFDVLNYNPDLVLLDFSVQDAISSQAKTNSRGYDNLVRRILESKNSPAVMTLLLTGAEQTTYSMNAKNANMFVSASEYQKEVSKWYDIPVIDFEGAVWENFTELVKVTTKKEIPLITWADIASGNNINMNNDGHTILGGAITNFLDGVLQKLDKIPATIPALPADTYFGIDKYMKGSFITVSDIIEGPAKDKGYAFNMDVTEMQKFEYSYRRRSDTGTTTDSMIPNITTYRHYIPVTDKEDDIDDAVNEKYLELTLPAVTSTETYFLLGTTPSVKQSAKNSNIAAFSPVSLVFYGADGERLTTSKAPCGSFTETTSHGKTSAIKIPVGTTKIEIKVYTSGGTVRLYGIGQFEVE